MPLTSEPPRFLTLADVADVLNVSERQVYNLVRRGELLAIRIGGKGVWRVERSELEAFIQRQYSETRGYLSTDGEDERLPSAGDRHLQAVEDEEELAPEQ